MTAINLTDGPKEYAEFKIGKKVKQLHFNDDLNLEIAQTQFKVGKLLKELSDKDKMSELDEKSAYDQRKYIEGVYGKLRKILTDFFDKHFDKGTGAKLYQLTGKSTERMAAAFSMVAREYEELRDERDNYINSIYKTRKALKLSKKA